MLPALAYRNPQKGEAAVAMAEWIQLQRIVTCVNQPGGSFQCGSISFSSGCGDFMVTPTPCTEQAELFKEHLRNPGAMLHFLFLVFQPR